MAYTDTHVSDMIFNILTSGQYSDLQSNGQLNSNQLYFITDDGGQRSLTIQLNGGTTEDSDQFTYNGASTKHINITAASIGAVSTTGSAASAEKWTTARDFIIQDADGTNSGIAVSVDGSANATLKLPATIKASITGNATTADSVNHSLIIKLNSGTTEGSNQFTYNGSTMVNNTVNITPGSINAVNRNGDTMVGGLTFGNDSTAYNTKGILFTGGSRIGENTSGDLALYATRNIYFRPASNGSANTTDGIKISSDGVAPTNNNTEDLGDSSHKWKTVYATTFSGNASSADRVNNSLIIKLNGGTTEGSNLFTYNGSPMTNNTVNITPSAIGALADDGAAASADKWTTAREFKIASSDGSNQSDAVSVDGSGNVVLKLASTIKASLTGNATSADKVNNSLIIKLNGGTTEGSNLFTYNGSPMTNNTVNITPTAIGALALAGGTMTGDITFQAVGTWPAAQDQTYPASSYGLSWSGESDSAKIFYRLNANNTGALVIRLADDGNETVDFDYGSTTKIKLNPSQSTFYPNTNDNGSLGTSARKWNAVYATNLYGNATSADKVNHSLIIKLNGGTTEGSNLFTYNGEAMTNNTVNITPAAIGAVAKSGDTMTGFLTLHANPTNAMHAVTKQYADGLIAAADAMQYKGAISGSATSPGTMTPAANAGDTYRVDTAGLINGEPVEVGDLLICNTDNTAAATTSTYSSISTKWNIIQVNVDKAVYYGSNSLTSEAILVGDSSTGKVKNPGAVGSNTNPIYLSGAGIPTALTYTANRLYYSASTSSFEAGTHYASSTQIAINSTSAPASGVALHVNGKVTTTDNITTTKGNTEQPEISVTNGTHQVGIMVGSGGTNHGLYSHTATADWIIYRSGGGNVYISNWKNIGNTDQPVYFDSNGRPIATQFKLAAQVDAGTANRIAWYKSANEVAAASTHYISDSVMKIGANTAPASGVTFHVEGKSVLNGIVELKANQYYGSNDVYAIHLNNSDIIGINSMYFADKSENASEGISFPNGTSGKWDTIYAANGFLYFAGNRAKNGTESGSVVPHTGNTTGSIGSSTQGVYVDGGQIKGMSKTLASDVGTGTQYGVAYYSTTTAISSTGAGAANTALMGKGSAAPAFVAVSPSQTWTDGTTAGPTLKITVLGVSSTASAIPSADGTTKSGIVTTTTQSFGGAKTFINNVVIQDATASTSKSTGSLRVGGGIGAIGQVSALRYMVDDHVTLQYNATTQSLDFIFS